MRRPAIVMAAAQRDAMRHMLLAGVRPRDLTIVMRLTPQQVSIRPRRRRAGTSFEVRPC